MYLVIGRNNEVRAAFESTDEGKAAAERVREESEVNRLFEVSATEISRPKVERPETPLEREKRKNAELEARLAKLEAASAPKP